MNLFKPTKTLPNGAHLADGAINPAAGLADQAENLAEQAAEQSVHLVRETRVATDEALDALSGGIESVAHRAPEVVRQMGARVEHLAQRGIDQVRDTSAQVRERVSVAGERTVSRIQDEPVKAVLIAAAAGAALTVLLGWWNSRGRQRI